MHGEQDEEEEVMKYCRAGGMEGGSVVYIDE